MNCSNFSSTIKKILPTIINVLVLLYNLIFKGGCDAYPSGWLSFVNALPKKGKLLLPKIVRFITVMGIFEKVYQIIMNKRLYSFLKIPSQQTAYQKFKGCNLHVMTMRLMKVLAKKTKQKLFVVFTDFEAAFDLVSRRLLFKKLIQLGVSALLLQALIAIYAGGKSVVEHNQEYSDYLLLLAGVKQGAPPSGILYIAYTMGIIDMYKNSFNPEPLIWIYHLLVHADDTLMLATSRELTKQKVLSLLEYCCNNFIKLQLTKCAFMCINSDDVEDEKPFQFQNLMLNATSEEVYLGSAITNSVNIADDVKADIKHRQFSIVKYFSFLRCNKNAPTDVKKIILDACSLSSLLYNAETWACANLDNLGASYRRMLKAILGIGTTVCNEIVYIELGVVSVKVRVLIKQWRFWNSVLKLEDDDPLVYIVREAEKHKLKEVKHYKKLIETYATAEEIVAEFFENMKSSIRKKAEAGRSKYLTYLKINPNLETPTMYDKIQKHTAVSMIGRLRTSSHNLKVEMGRRSRTPREQRLCVCGNGVEDEEHFLVDCLLYDDIRRKHGVKNMTVSELLGSEKYVDYVYDLYERRKEIV